jgi:YVTN family beta-propeller protein
MGAPTAGRALRGVAIATTSACLSALLFSALAGGQGLAGALPGTTGVAAISAGKPIAVGSGPAAIAITPDGKTAYVVNGTSGTVTPIETATNKPGPAITVGREPAAIAITPDGKTAYVANTSSGTVTPITTATDTAGPPITVGKYPMSIAITPSGKTAYVANFGSGTVTVLATATDRAIAQVEVGKMPQVVLITPDGKTAYVANFGSNSVSPIDTATNKAGPAIAVGSEPYALAFVPHHQSMYVVNYGSGTVTPISTATNKVGRAVRVGTDPESISFIANGDTAVVANEGSNSETRIDTTTDASSTAPVGNAPVSVLIESLIAGHLYSHYGSYNPWDVPPVLWSIVAIVCDNNATLSKKDGYAVITFDQTGTGPLDLGGDSSHRDEPAIQQDPVRRIPLGSEPGPMAFSPSNSTLYVVNEGSGDVTPIAIKPD